MILDVVRAQDAPRLLADGSFRRQWETLCAVCPWATAFQSPAFVFTWYDVYKHEQEPILILGRDSAGSLAGILPLALSPSLGLGVAGRWHAEYQAWICSPDLAATFPKEALAACRNALPERSFAFQYLPAGIPLDWLNDSAACPNSALRAVPRPLRRLGDAAEADRLLAKTVKKCRMGRLRSIGNLEFFRASPEQAETLFQQFFIDQYDARRLAMSGLPPFRSDPLKKTLFQAMLRQPGLMHVTVFRVGQHIASMQLHTISGQQLHYNLLTHNPTLSLFSPGKLHLAYLCQMLIKEGFNLLDLTPGDDWYKEHSANAGDQVHVLTLYRSGATRALSGARDKVRQFTRSIQEKLPAIDWRHSTLRGVSHDISDFCRAHARRIWSERRTAIFYGTPKRLLANCPPSVQVDSIPALLNYTGGPGLPSPQDFMRQALQRLEKGHRVYTICDSGRLLSAAWLADAAEPAMLSEFLPGVPIAPGGAIAYDVQTFARGASPAPCLLAALHDAVQSPPANSMYCILSDFSNVGAASAAVFTTAAVAQNPAAVFTTAAAAQNPAAVITSAAAAEAAPTGADFSGTGVPPVAQCAPTASNPGFAHDLALSGTGVPPVAQCAPTASHPGLTHNHPPTAPRNLLKIPTAVGLTHCATLIERTRFGQQKKSLIPVNLAVLPQPVEATPAEASPPATSEHRRQESLQHR